MAIFRDHGRQTPLVATLDIKYSDITAGTQTDAIAIPAGATIIGGSVVVNTPFNSGTSDTVKVGDSGDDDRYTASAVNIHTAGMTALTLTGYKYTVPSLVTVLWTAVGAAATAGSITVRVTYIIDGRCSEVQPG